MTIDTDSVMPTQRTARAGGTASLWCAVAAVAQLWAGLIVFSVWTSESFAADFENGTRLADAGAAAIVATVLTVVAILSTLAAIFHPRASGLVCGIGALLLVSGCVTGLLALPLLEHYR
ncbi:MAG: hypothetical protein WBB07_28620 [Mycobacterium sp.]